jgi:hypothetical protein
MPDSTPKKKGKSDEPKAKNSGGKKKNASATKNSRSSTGKSSKSKAGAGDGPSKKQLAALARGRKARKANIKARKGGQT